MPSIAFATCRDVPEISEDDALLAAALRELGHEVHGVPWDAPDVKWATFDAVLLRSCWDYFAHAEQFVRWIMSVDSATTILNAPGVVLPTLHKKYLFRAARAGVAIPATVLIDRRKSPDIEHVTRRLGGPIAVVKPAISASAHETHLVDLRSSEGAATIARLGESMDVLVQEFLPSIRDGELSLVYIEGRFSHAVRKCPAAQEWRVQAPLGGAVTPEPVPEDAVLAFASRSLKACASREPTYARVDLVDTPRGPVLMEVELIEPVLFLRSCSSASQRIAEAVARQIASSIHRSRT